VTADRAVVAREVRARYPGTLALDGLSVDVAVGEVVGLIGPDGAGKTTFLRILAGARQIDGGTVTVFGRDLVREWRLLRELRGYVAQGFALYGDLTVGENLAFVATAYGAPAAPESPWGRALLDFCGLTPFRDRLADHLSGGMKKKLAIACGAIHRPRLLILDEPTAGVDPVSRRDIWRALYRARDEGITIVVASAYLDEAERFDRVALLAAGRALAFGSPSALRSAYPYHLREVVLRDRSVPSLREARDQIARDRAIAGVQLFGDRLHVAGYTPESVSAALERLGESVTTDRSEPIVPTIEDVFLASRTL